MVKKTLSSGGPRKQQYTKYTKASELVSPNSKATPTAFHSHAHTEAAAKIDAEDDFHEAMLQWQKRLDRFIRFDFEWVPGQMKHYAGIITNVSTSIDCI